MDNLLEIKNLIVEYNSLKKQKDDLVVAVNDVSLSIKEGEIYALAGESGCGKSTLAKAITKLVRPNQVKYYLKVKIFLNMIILKKKNIQS